MLSLPDFKQRLAQALAANAFVRAIFVYEEAGSTNDLAKDLARNGAPEGTLVLALRQTAGRGRPGRSWESPEGGFWGSLILRPPDGRTIPHLSLVTALAVARTLESLGISARIKWPNDVVVDDRKIAGILIEASSHADTVPFLIVGVGVNLNFRTSALSPEVQGLAVTLLEETGRPIELDLFTAALLDTLREKYGMLRRGGWPQLLVEVQGLDNLLGRRVTVDAGPWRGTRTEGTARGLDEEGRLLVESGSKTHRFISGEVRTVRQHPSDQSQPVDVE